MIKQYYTISGILSTRQVFIDGVELDPKAGQEIINHSPDGFMWGYGGSGPAQLALSIVLFITNSITGYQNFKWEFVAKLPKDKSFEVVISNEDFQRFISGNPYLSQKRS